MKTSLIKASKKDDRGPSTGAASARALRRAARIVGGFEVLAARLDVAASTPRMWLTRNRIPEGHCLPIELLTGGRVRCESLRPDLRPKWAELRRSMAIGAASQ